MSLTVTRLMMMIISCCCFLSFLFVPMSWASSLSIKPTPVDTDSNLLPDVPTTCEHLQVTNYLQQLTANYPNISRLMSIGKSVRGRNIWVMIVSDSPAKRPLLRPQIKFVGNVNGVSGPACFVLLKLIKYLLKGYGREGSTERKLVEMNEIHILPDMNPDGYANAILGSCDGGEGRLNSNGINLNRNFPDVFHPDEVPMKRQPETVAIMNWIHNNKFLISVSLMSGAWVVTYPFDSIPSESEEEESRPRPGEAHLTPDDDIFKHLAYTYVETFEETLGGWHCPTLQRTFPNGMINGAEWAPAKGTMLDFNYIRGTFELMIGITCCRMENNTKLLEALWVNNKLGLLKMINEADSGLRGQVVDSETNQGLSEVQLLKQSQHYTADIDTNSMPWFTNMQGEFWRPLLPGRYNLQVNLDGYKEKIIPFEVTVRQPTTLIISLEKIVPATTPKLLTSASPDQISAESNTIKVDEISKRISSKEEPKPPASFPTITYYQQDQQQDKDSQEKEYQKTKSNFNLPLHKLLGMTSSSPALSPTSISISSIFLLLFFFFFNIFPLFPHALFIVSSPLY